MSCASGYISELRLFSINGEGAYWRLEPYLGLNLAIPGVDNLLVKASDHIVTRCD